MPLPDINQELNKATQTISTVLGAPLKFTNLGSDDTSFWVEATESP